MSIRLLEFKQEDGKDMYLVDYPSKGQRWVYSFMIGGQYKEEKAALKYRYEQRSATNLVPSAPDSNMSTVDDAKTSEAPGSTIKLPHIEQRDTLKCICQQQQATPGEEIITCSLCSKRSHVRCVRAEGQTATEIKEWQCPFCRLLHMDPFSPGVELLMFTATPRNMLAPSSQEGNLSMRFNVQPNVLKEWQTKKMSVVVRCVGLGPKSLNVPKGPLWPKEATASVNTYKDVFRIQPGKYGHVRREVPSKEITDLVKPNSNTVTLQYRTEAPGNTQVQPPRFLFGVIACEGRSKQDILSLIKRPTVDEAKQRDFQLVDQAHQAFIALQSQELMIETKADFDIVHTRCPLSLWEISTPVRGVECEHLDCYDADSFVDVNIKTRNVEKRWRCPICSKLTRPEDLIIDEFLVSGMAMARAELGLPEDEPLLKRLKLDSQRGVWLLLEDEALEGEGSDDEDHATDQPDQKRRKKEEGDQDEIILD
jgi:hypothetical protein